MTKKQASSDWIIYAKAIDAIENVIEILTKDSLNSEDEIIDFIKWFLRNKNKFLVYLGAGVSKNIEVKYKDGKTKGAFTQNWQELLRQVFYNFKRDNQRKFLRSASARAGGMDCLDGKSIENLTEDEWKEAFKKNRADILQELLNKLGPFRFAWSLRWFAQDTDGLASTEMRDKIISSIVNKTIEEDRDRTSENFRQVEVYRSDLLSEIVKLPFREAITTNYDHYLEIFLDDSNKRNFFSVYDNETLIRSFQKYRTQLFYLHGKAALDGKKYSDNLVFDKYDYAQLFTKNNQILNHLVRLFLRYGVLYVGFGLDDQTFDYMESQIKIFCEETGAKVKHIPESYALMRSEEIAENEVKALRELFNIKVIRFKNFPDVPEILKNINKMIEYTEDRQIDWLDEGQKKRVEDAMDKAGKRFLSGDLEGSIFYYRKAIAHTLFWTIEEASEDDVHWANIQTICQIYRRIILTRSKLRWSSGWNDDRQNREIDINFKHTAKIIKDYREQNKALLSTSKKTAVEINKQLLVEKIALRLLRARINYQEGRFVEAVEEFRKFILENNQDDEYSKAVLLIKELIQDGTKRKLENYEMLLLETSYFARCQFDRADTIFSNQSNYFITDAVFVEVKDIHMKQSKLCKKSEKDTLRLKEFGNVAVIAKWGVAVSKLRDYRFFLNLAEKDQNIEKLYEIENLLDEGCRYAADNDCEPSPRWVTVKHRSRCRALGLLWFNLKEQPDKLAEASDKLTEAYRAIQDALELTSSKPALKGQHTRNLLEAVRLNLITNLPVKESILESSPINSAMCFAASYHYLQAAFKEIEEVLKGESEESQPYIWWLLIQAYEMACFWKIVFHGFIKDNSKKTEIKLLDKFFEQTDMKQFIEDEYMKFDKEVLGKENKVEGRIKSFQNVYEMAVKETGFK